MKEARGEGQGRERNSLEHILVVRSGVSPTTFYPKLAVTQGERGR